MISSDTTFRQYFPVGRKLALVLLVVLGISSLVGATTAQSLPLVIGLLPIILLLFAIIIWPDTPTLIVCLILYTNAAVIAVQFHGVPYGVAASLPVLLVIPLAHYLIFRREKLIINPILPLIILFLVIQMVSTLLTKQFNVAVKELLTFATEGVGLYFLITNTVRTAKILRLTIWVLLIGGLFLGGLSLYQQITGAYDNEFGGFAQVSQAAFNTGEETLQGEVQQWRLAGPVGQQNRYAQMMLMLAPLGLFRFWGERSSWLRLLAAIATILITIGAMLTFSRGAAIGFLMILIIMGFMRYLKIYQLIIVCLGVGLLMQAFPQYGMRLTSLQVVSGAVTDDGNGNGIEATDSSTQSRVTEMMAAWLMFTDHPMIGVGPGMYRHYYQDYAQEVGIKAKATERESHSLYLGLAAENGILGVICFSAIVLAMLGNLARIRKRFKQSRPEFAHLATGFTLAILAYLTTGLFLHFAFIRFFWLIMALAGALSYVVETETLLEKEAAPPELATTNIH